MAATAGSGGLGALAIGGIATVAVVIGGVVLMQMGVFKNDPAAVDQVETVEEAVVTVPDTDVSSSPIVATEPANSNAQAGVETQVEAEPSVAETTSQPVETVEDQTPEVSDDAVAGMSDDVEPDLAETVSPQPGTPSAEVADESSVSDTPAEVGEVSTADATEGVSQQPVESETEPKTETAIPPADETEVSDTAEATNPQETPVEQTEQAEAVSQQEPETAIPEAVEEPAFVLIAPELDLVRFDADGAGVIAGRAQAGVQVSVLLDDNVLDQFQVQKGGEFVSFTSIEPSAQARVVSLQAAFDGQVITSDASFILAPSVAVAAVEPQAEQPPQPVLVPSELAAAELQPKQAGTEIASVVDEQSDVTVAEETSDVSDSTDDDVSSTEIASTDTQEHAVSEDTQVASNSTEESSSAESTPKPDDGASHVQVAEAREATPQAVAKPTTEIAPQPQPSPIAIAVLKTDSSGVELIQPAIPAEPELLGKVALDTISYSDEGAVQLAGRAGPESLVRVYLDNSPVADIRAAVDGHWKVQLGDVAPGIYTLRLDELDPAGKVLSRLETPFKRESPEALRPPAVPEGNPVQAAPLVRAVTVQEGDTLWAISRERYGDGLLYVRVFEANKKAIRNPDLIYPGQIFSIPE
ncbi:LysM peptidoglycan-binding domain-containing protein [Parasedimentitalea maritima]|nr:LysM peptidoglycan-binding domain-containing protein [Zongyanglinia marina]